MTKPRTPVPDDISAEVMFQHDRTCCVCRDPGLQVQIHHIDEDPTNHAIDNLAVLCLEHHEQTQTRGGFARKLRAADVIPYRDDWVRRVRDRRDKADDPPIAASVIFPDVEIRFEPRAPYETAEVNSGRVLSLVRIGLKASGQPFSNCKVFIEKIAPEPPIYGGLPMLLQGSDFMLRHDDPEDFLDIAGHWEHTNQFRFHNVPGFFAESYNYIDDGIDRTFEIKVTCIKSDGSELIKTKLFTISTDKTKKVHLKPA